MGIVGIAVVGGADETIAFSAGGRRAATCSPLKPPQEMPIMPHAGAPGLRAEPVDDLEASSCSRLTYSSSRPSESPRAADVDAHEA